MPNMLPCRVDNPSVYHERQNRGLCWLHALGVVCLFGNLPCSMHVKHHAPYEEHPGQEEREVASPYNAGGWFAPMHINHYLWPFPSELVVVVKVVDLAIPNESGMELLAAVFEKKEVHCVRAVAVNDGQHTTCMKQVQDDSWEGWYFIDYVGPRVLRLTNADECVGRSSSAPEQPVGAAQHNRPRHWPGCVEHLLLRRRLLPHAHGGAAPAAKRKA
jgi:hypothetical protein